MPRILLTIEGDVVGPMSIGTVAVIRALERHLALPLGAAIEAVERCVFDREQVTLPADTRASAEALLAELARLPAAERLQASIID